MSNLSGASTGSSSARSRGRVFGVPKTCHCGEQVMELISKSNNNPYRRYFHCGYAVARKVIRSPGMSPLPQMSRDWTLLSLLHNPYNVKTDTHIHFQSTSKLSS
ncbi:unnamed protein product [Microthlaspi erraticum]|uniref:Zinc finger GRF-type domain-containing protein n=1 Tax=Microthlaspi erraticum TaxID=1685480 RepID=A0A6D2HZZ8_9BRAS|nr:unnamed protein product [Microthlaspi erraticum]